MKKLKHTKGPWKVMIGKIEGEEIVAVFPDSAKGVNKKVRSICLISPAKDFTDQDAEDLKLIVSAPDLLEACKEALKMYNKLQPAGGYQYVHDILQSAINKATK